MEEGGGFVPFGWLVTQSPDFTLYGDGTVIYKQTDNRPDPWALPMLPWLVGHLDEEGIQALLDYALNEGRLATARERYEQMNIADAGTTFFRFDAGGVQKTVEVYALGLSEEPGPEQADRQAFARLAETLRSFEQRGAAGELGEVTPYDPPEYRATLLEAFGEPVGQEPMAWPFVDIEFDEFGQADEFGARQRLISREEAALLTDVPSGGHQGVWVEAPDGTVWQIALRPLLPDELSLGIRDG
jgi:hypothetical protein